ncbi:MAG TPA: hypothetical protein P5567_13500 [Kiritimatiellia bacterium]|nr:hypothetical protein [Kiritimatiellia bacterium]HRZ13458.1 hypothetical protein [Kiritimatiellia bacterium]HSA19664.1 hypothetical protein [Kiritimatiellia bacterium]
MKREAVIRGAAAGLFVLGILLAARAAWQTEPVAAQIRAKLADLEQMRSLQAGSAREEQAVAFFEGMADHRPAPLRELAGRLFPGFPSAVQTGEDRPAASGWTIRAAEISLDPVSFADISRLLLELRGDGTRPPWQLTDCQIKASEQGAGQGRVVLGVQALEK